MAKVLFLLRDGTEYGSPGQVNYGLLNAANFVVSEIAPTHQGDVRIVSNEAEIASIVSTYQPTHVVIEGIWVEPAYLAALKAAYPLVKWRVRVHSEIPFLGTESSALQSIADYLNAAIEVISNSPRAHEQLSLIADSVGGVCSYLPNCYVVNYSANPILGLDTSAKSTLDIGCFGASRTLKNTLQQLFVAHRYTKSVNKNLNFHVNAATTSADTVILQNVLDAAAALGDAVTIHAWEDRSTFLSTIRSMDLVLQLSLSETFNNTAADAVLVGRPLLTSSEIKFTQIHADPASVDDCLQKLVHIMGNKRFFINANRAGLRNHSVSGKSAWMRYLI